MTIVTKLELNDRQWVIRSGAIEEVKITQIKIIANIRNGTSGGVVTSSSYKVDWCDPSINLYSTKQLGEMFDTKQDAGMALLKANGLDISLTEVK